MIGKEQPRVKPALILTGAIRTCATYRGPATLIGVCFGQLSLLDDEAMLDFLKRFRELEAGGRFHSRRIGRSSMILPNFKPPAR